MAWLAPAAAQDGLNDPSFNPLDSGVFGDGPNGGVSHVLVQPDGKALIVGGFSAYNLTGRLGLARVNVDGSLDTGFDPGQGAAGPVHAVALQPDGKLLVAGQFSGFDGASANSVARLLPSGARDPSFDSGLGAVNTLTALALQPDGKVLVGGAFYQGSSVSYTVKRLLPDGALDLGFDAGPSSGIGSFVRSIAVQADGKVLVGGDFTSFGGVARPRIARLNSDGSSDASFAPGAGPDSHVSHVQIQPDGRVLLSGYFEHVAGVSRRFLARLHANGALDTSFDPGAGPSSSVRTIALQSDGKLLLGGEFTEVAGIAARRFARLNADGSVDTSFDSSNGANGAVVSLARQADGKVLLGGSFTDVAGVHRRYLARVDDAAGFEFAYNAGGGADNHVRVIALRSDGRALVGGEFTVVNGAPRSRLAQLDSTGAVDTTFDPGSGVNGSVYALAHQPDGKSLVTGAISDYDGAPVRSIVRVSPDGSRDASFDAGAGAYPSSPFAIALQPDGRILLGGAFTSFNGAPRGSLVRLSTTGAVDPSFTTPGGGAYGVNALALQPDGRILIAGGFTSYGAVTRNCIARLHPDGSLDMSFNASTAWDVGVSYGVNALTLQPDGKVLIGGPFTSYSTAPRAGIARLNADGSLDTSFDPGAGVAHTSTSISAAVTTIRLQPDGRVLIAGSFTHVDGVSRRNLARLNADGSLDLSFDPGPGGNRTVHTLALEPSGRVWVGGDFTICRGVPRGRLARLIGFLSAPTAYCTAGTSSSGCTPAIASSGVPSASATSGFTLAVSGLEGQRSGLLYYGVSGRRELPWGAGSSSWACVDAPTQRLGVASSGGTVGQCNGAFSEDWLAWVAAHPTALGQPLFPGQLVAAQAWYRDPAAPRGSNLSNGVEFMLGP